MGKKDEPKKLIPINKYSIYELKSALDQNISTYLEEQGFIEDQTFSNVKIIVGFISVLFTALAYFYPGHFPESYKMILFSVVGYSIFSSIYWYLEKKVIKTVFYVGSNGIYCQKYRKKKKGVRIVRINSDVPQGSANYNIWFDMTYEDGSKNISEKSIIDCTHVVDQRGYVLKDNVQSCFTKIFHEQLEKMI